MNDSRQKYFRRASSILALTLVCSTIVVADTPLPPPVPVHVCSSNGQYCVDSIPGRDTVVRRADNPRSVLWRIPGWYRSIFVSDAGTVAIAFDGLNLLPLNYDRDMPLVQTWREGKIDQTVRVRDVVKNKQSLRRTASHYEWGSVDGFDKIGSLVLTTVTGKQVHIEDWNAPVQYYFPADTVGPFRTVWYSTQLVALEEPSLWEASKKSPAESYRFTWLRTFHHPIVVRVDVRSDGIGVLTTKITSGAGGYAPGKLIENRTQPLTRAQSEQFLGWVATLRFWNSPLEDDRTLGCDGAQWIIEGTKGGKYHVVDRWSPENGPMRKLGLAMAIGLSNLKIPKEDIY